jgi:drug/metabolite transporter (DMT)-like permease
MEWLIFVLINVISGSLIALLLKKTAQKYKTDTLTISFYGFLFASIIYLPFVTQFYLANPILPSEPIAWAYMGIAMIIGAVYIFCFMKAYRIGKLSTNGPLENIRPISAAIFSVIFLQEVLTLNILTATALVVIGGFVVHLTGGVKKTIKEISKSKASVLMIFAATLAGIMAVADKLALGYFKPEIAVFFVMAGNALVYFLIYTKVKKKKINMSAEYIKRTLLLGCLIVVSTLSIYNALNLGSPIYVVPVQMTRSIVIAIFGSIFLGETGLSKKLLGAIIMLAGVILLVI